MPKKWQRDQITGDEHGYSTLKALLADANTAERNTDDGSEKITQHQEDCNTTTRDGLELERIQLLTNRSDGDERLEKSNTKSAAQEVKAGARKLCIAGHLPGPQH